MQPHLRNYIRSSVFKKQIVAVTGLMLVGFIIVHMGGNLIIFAGPEAFNKYAEALRATPLLLWFARAGLLTAVIVHIFFTVQLVLENRRARGDRYEVYSTFGSTSFAKRTMIYTGLLIFFFVFLHLYDFTFTPKDTPKSDISGIPHQLYGLVWNSFLAPWRSIVYILAVCAVGLHLSHGIQSFFQTLGTNDDHVGPTIIKISRVIGLIVAVGFSSIPIYVLLKHYLGTNGV